MAPPHMGIFSVFIFFFIFVSIPPWDIPAGYGASLAGSVGLPASSEALPAGSEALPAGSKALQLALRPSKLAPRLSQLDPRPSKRCIFLKGSLSLLGGPPNWIQGPPRGFI